MTPAEMADILDPYASAVREARRYGGPSIKDELQLSDLVVNHWPEIAAMLCQADADRAELAALREAVPSYALGYFDGWSDHKAGRAYGEASTRRRLAVQSPPPVDGGER
jgi:hypothetical protein